MKIFKYLVSILFLYNCHCEHCNDNLSEENKKIIYTDSSIVCFKNDTLGIINDTVFVTLGKIRKLAYACNGGSDDDQYLCSGRSCIKYSNLFIIEIIQSPNLLNCDNCTGIGFPFEYQDFIVTDTISYIYNNKSIKALHTYFKTDTAELIIWKKNISLDSLYVYNNYIYVKDSIIKLLEYTTLYENGTKRKWKLKE